jgi:hypothetical protein
VFEAGDLNHAIQLMSKHPAVKSGSIEIRRANDLTEMIRQSERRRSRTKDKSAVNVVHSHCLRCCQRVMQR